VHSANAIAPTNTARRTDPLTQANAGPSENSASRPTSDPADTSPTATASIAANGNPASAADRTDPDTRMSRPSAALDFPENLALCMRIRGADG
jgi:hypothetical protein